MFFSIHSIDCSNTAPAVARNTVNNGTGLNFIGGSSLAPIIIPSGQTLLPWLHRIVLFPLTQPAPVPNFSTSPAVVNVPSHILWRNPQLFEVGNRAHVFWTSTMSFPIQAVSLFSHFLTKVVTETEEITIS